MSAEAVPPIAHATVRVDRRYPFSPARVFSIWEDPETRKRLEPVPEGFEMVYDRVDFSVGGREACRMLKDGQELAAFTHHYIDITQGERIVWTVAVFVGGQPMSISQNCLEFRPDGAHTHLLATEQVAWLTGQPMLEEHQGGWSAMLDLIDAELQRA